jgi:hypothetical protein
LSWNGIWVGERKKGKSERETNQKVFREERKIEKEREM